MQEEELHPLRLWEQTIAGMLTRALQGGGVHSFEQRDQGLAIQVDGGEQPAQGLLNVTGIFGIGFRDIAGEEWVILLLDAVDPMEKDRLITREVGDILEGAPFGGIDPQPELLFGQSAGQLPNGLVLVAQAGKDRCR